MGYMHFDISIPLVSKIKLIVAKTNSLRTVLYVLNEKKYKIPHKTLYMFKFNAAVKK